MPLFCKIQDYKNCTVQCFQQDELQMQIIEHHLGLFVRELFNLGLEIIYKFITFV